MYKNIIHLFSFSFITRYVRNDRVRKRVKEIYTQGEIWIFSEQLLPRSTFARLEQGPLKTLNHLSITSLLYFCESGIGPFQESELSSTRCSTFTILVRAIPKQWMILDSHRFSAFPSLVQFRLFSTSQLWAVRHKANAGSSVTSFNSSVSLFPSQLVSSGVEIFPGLYHFPDTLAVLGVTAV